MNKIKLTIITIFMILFSQQIIFANSVNIVINDKNIEFSDDSGIPYIDKNFRTMVPLRATMEAIGCSVGYDLDKNTAIVISENKRLEILIGTDFLYYNNEVIQNDTYSVVNNGRTYLPIRVILETLEYSVEWDSISNSVVAYKNYFGDKLVPYSTSDLATLTKNILNGNVVLIDGSYYTTPQYNNMLANTVTIYTGDNLNTAIYPQQNRFDIIDTIDKMEKEAEWVVPVLNFGTRKYPISQIPFSTENLKLSYIEDHVEVYTFYKNSLTGTMELMYPIINMTDEFAELQDAPETVFTCAEVILNSYSTYEEPIVFSEIRFIKKNGEFYIHKEDLERLGLEYSIF